METKHEDVLKLVQELEKLAATQLKSKVNYKLQEEGVRGWFDLKSCEATEEEKPSYSVEVFKNIEDALYELDFICGEFPDTNYRVVPVFTPGQWDPYE